MKILHSSDWHLDSPISGRTPRQAEYLKTELLKIPRKIAALCKKENCQLMLLAGDLFDGEYTKESYRQVYDALREVQIPVFIAPGNHDFCSPKSPYLCEVWPENVHIFTHQTMESQYLPELDCTVYGAGYTAMDCPALLENFKADGQGKWQIGLLHGDPTTTNSHYCPVSARQVHASGLDYLALGHIHKPGSFRSGDALCAWPGCPMGRGYDEPGQKGTIILSLDEKITARFIPMDAPRFFDEMVDVGDNPETALADILPPAETEDFYRVTLTGYASGLNLMQLRSKFPQLPNLELRDGTMPETELWSGMDEDNLEGVYFKTLHDAMEETNSLRVEKCLKLAARISRQILDGQEVKLP